MKKKQIDQIHLTLEDLSVVNKFDWELKLVVGNECCWSAELRITINPNTLGPDISTVLYATGGYNAEAVANEVYLAAIEHFKWNNEPAKADPAAGSKAEK